METLSQTNDFKFQELIRILAATLRQVNPTGQSNGQNGIWLTSMLLRFPGMEGWISPALKEMCENLISTEGGDNPRQELEKMYMHPIPQYLPWEKEQITFEQLDHANRQVEEHNRFEIRMEKGMVRANCTRDPDFMQNLHYSLRKNKPYIGGMLSNKECHITLLHPALLRKVELAYNLEDVEKFIDSFARNLENGQFFSIRITDLVSSFSRNWERFGLFYAFVVQSDYIEKFLAEFESRFPIEGESFIEKSQELHITICTYNRDLWSPENSSCIP
jgi:hypothetical protein